MYALQLCVYCIMNKLHYINMLHRVYNLLLTSYVIENKSKMDNVLALAISIKISFYVGLVQK